MVIQLSKNFKVSRPTIYKILNKANLTPKNEYFSENTESNKDMENTTFLGVTIDTINGPLDFKIKKALKQSASLLKRNDDEHYQYYTIRAQHNYTERRIKTQKALFPQLQILLDFTAHPNLYNRIKKELKAKNNIDLEETEIDEQELINKMKVINDQKYDV